MRYDSDMGHHAAVFVFQNVTVINEISHLGKRDCHFNRLNPASS
jgi:hypothetical protein